MHPNDKQFKQQLNAEPAGEKEILEHQYHEAMSQDPRYTALEDLESMGNEMWKAEQEKKKNAS